MAIAQHLPCLGLLLGVSGQRTGPYASYRSTHRSTLSSQASDLSWVSRQRRQESLGSESEMVRIPGPLWLAVPSSTRAASGLWAELPQKLKNPHDTGTLAGRAPPSLPLSQLFQASSSLIGRGSGAREATGWPKVTQQQGQG